MIPTQELAKLLQRTARRLESQHYFGINLEYNWHKSSRCNCGLLVREALDMDEPQLRQHIYNGTWQSAAQAVFQSAQQRVSLGLEPADPLQPEPTEATCSLTGLNLGFVFNHMRELGFNQPQDFQHLEYLSDPAVLARLQAQGITTLRHSHAPDVAVYMRELASLIQETLAAQLQINQLTLSQHPQKSTSSVQQSVHLS